MLDFLRRFFNPETSSSTAKERLRLVLLSDRISLAPDVVEALKLDLLEVISRYVEVDESHTEINFEQREREVAMLANIPILSLKPRPPAPPPREEEPVAVAVAETASAQATSMDVQEPPSASKPRSANGNGTRRRRKRASLATPPNLNNPAQAT